VRDVEVVALGTASTGEAAASAAWRAQALPEVHWPQVARPHRHLLAGDREFPVAHHRPSRIPSHQLHIGDEPRPLQIPAAPLIEPPVAGETH
jgi:hypothetical protein